MLGASCFQQKRAEALQETPMTFRRNCTEHPEHGRRRKYGKETKPDDRGRLESTSSEVRMRRLDNVVEADDLLM